MRLRYVLAVMGVCLSALPHQVSAEDLKGAARREYERLTSEGLLSTSCRANSGYFVVWAGTPPSVLDIEAKQEPVSFEPHKVGDYLKAPYRCPTPDGPLTMRTTLTHSISNIQCGAGNRFLVKLAVARVGSFSDDFLVDGCGGTSGLLVRGKHILLCRMPDDETAGVGHCAEATDSPGPRELR